MVFTPRRVTEEYCVQGQLAASDVAKAKAMGFQSIINNRPDAEEEGQPQSCQIAAAAAEAGLAYVHIPVSGPITGAQTEAMRQALVTLPQPILAFCRSGARSTRLWAHAMQGQLDEPLLLSAAAQAGCDTVALSAELQQLKTES